MPIKIEKGDITCCATDAIVNAARNSLLGGGGVDGAIHKAAGPSLLEECKAFPVDSEGDRCPTGSARITHAGDLPCKWIIHTVGPVYNPDETLVVEGLLDSAYSESIRAAVMLGCRSVAFPAISCGVYGYPLVEAAVTALEAAHYEAPDDMEVRFVLFTDEAVAAFTDVLASLEIDWARESEEGFSTLECW